MGVTTTKTNKPFNPRAQDASPLAYNRAALYSGKALDFDGANDYVDLDGFTMNGNTGTFCFYADVDNDAYIFDINPNRFIFLHNTAQGIRVFNTNGWSDYGLIDRETTLFYTIVFDGTSQSVYVNGQKFGDTKTITALDLSSATEFKLGSNYLGNGTFYNGTLSNYRIFNTALTAAQIADLYNNPEKIVPTGVDNTALKLWLPMMEGAGTTAYDGSGNGNHGTIAGATYVNGIGAPVAQSAVMDWNKGVNLLKYSEQFNNAFYLKSSIYSISANATTAPDGQTTAENIIPDTSSNQHYFYDVTIGLIGQHTISLFAKYNGYNIGIRPQGIGSGQAFANFDLQNGTILGSGGTSYEDSSITSFGDGWFRCSLTLNYASNYGVGIYSVKGTTATELPVFTGDGTSGVYAWGAQVNAGATLNPYVRTGATAQPTPVLLPAGLTTGRDITGVNLFENVRKQSALNLDGQSWAEVHDNASLDLTTAVTLEAWVKCGDELNSVYDHIFVKPTSTTWTSPYGTYVLRLRENDVQWWFESVANAESYSVSLSGWNHLVVTKNGTAEILYINGVQVDTNTGAATMSSTIYDLLIGTRTQYSTIEMVANQLAQPRIYNRALSAEEIQRNFNAGKNIYS